MLKGVKITLDDRLTSENSGHFMANNKSSIFLNTDEIDIQVSEAESDVNVSKSQKIIRLPRLIRNSNSSSLV